MGGRSDRPDQPGERSVDPGARFVAQRSSPPGEQGPVQPDVAAQRSAVIGAPDSAGTRSQSAFAEALPGLDERERAQRLLLLDVAMEPIDDALLDLRFAARGLRSLRTSEPVAGVEAAFAALDAARTNVALPGTDPARARALEEMGRSLRALQEGARQVAAPGGTTILLE